ncbi:hypothetical protein BtSCAC15_31865 (plasmid) [Bacillus thuringiensis]|nr:hypothetical protein BtSCAC15_31865 [Bacillus thuringiensis]
MLWLYLFLKLLSLCITLLDIYFVWYAFTLQELYPKYKPTLLENIFFEEEKGDCEVFMRRKLPKIILSAHIGLCVHSKTPISFTIIYKLKSFTGKSGECI